jgi:hypothetical protein
VGCSIEEAGALAVRVSNATMLQQRAVRIRARVAEELDL